MKRTRKGLCRLRFTNDDLQAALEDVKNGTSVNGAAKTHNVPEATLRRKIQRGETTITAGTVENGFLTREEEKQLFDWIACSFQNGCPLSTPDILAEAQRMLDSHPRSHKKGKELISRHWVHRFVTRSGAKKYILPMKRTRMEALETSFADTLDEQQYEEIEVLEVEADVRNQRPAGEEEAPENEVLIRAGKAFALESVLKHCPEDVREDLLTGTLDYHKEYGVNPWFILQSIVHELKPSKCNKME